MNIQISELITFHLRHVLSTCKWTNVWLSFFQNGKTQTICTFVAKFWHWDLRSSSANFCELTSWLCRLFSFFDVCIKVSARFFFFSWVDLNPVNVWGPFMQKKSLRGREWKVGVGLDWPTDFTYPPSLPAIARMQYQLSAAFYRVSFGQVYIIQFKATKNHLRIKFDN